MSTEHASAAAEQGAAAQLPPTFQDVIMNLQRYWGDQGCVVLQPYDNEVGAGTNAPATTLRSLGPDTWRTCYVQGSRRPTDGRYGENPNRTQHYFQFQVLMKPSPDNIQELDGVALSEPYTRGLPSYTLASDVSYPYTVPEGYLWMMGDNRTNSQDSRFFGAIPVSSVTGRGALVYWPLNDFSLLD